MYIIGLTGGVATGKSTVAHMLTELGAPVVDADAVAHRVVEPGLPAWEALLAAFGPGILHEDGRVNRRALARLAFGHMGNLDKLNRATHPFIHTELERQLAALAAVGTPVAVLDAPLLFEAGLTGMVDEVWVVMTDRATQVARLLERSDLTEDEAEARIDAQAPLEEKARRAGVVIDNRGTPAETRRQVTAAWERLLARLGPTPGAPGHTPGAPGSAPPGGRDVDAR